MSSCDVKPDLRYASLVSPLPSLGSFLEADREALLREESERLDGTSFRGLGRQRYRRGTQILRLGSLILLPGRTTPALSSNRSAYFSCFFAMPLLGGFVTTNRGQRDEVGPGDLYLNRNYYGTSRMGYLSSLFVALDQQRLDRAMRSISGGDSLASLEDVILVRGRSGAAKGTAKMWSFITYLDSLNASDSRIPDLLGLDEQFYRLLSLVLLEGSGDRRGSGSIGALPQAIGTTPSMSWWITSVPTRTEVSRSPILRSAVTIRPGACRPCSGRSLTAPRCSS